MNLGINCFQVERLHVLRYEGLVPFTVLVLLFITVAMIPFTVFMIIRSKTWLIALGVEVFIIPIMAAYLLAVSERY